MPSVQVRHLRAAHPHGAPAALVRGVQGEKAERAGCSLHSTGADSGDGNGSGMPCPLLLSALGSQLQRRPTAAPSSTPIIQCRFCVPPAGHALLQPRVPPPAVPAAPRRVQLHAHQAAAALPDCAAHRGRGACPLQEQRPDYFQTA
jgi:hypothetical protein